MSKGAMKRKLDRMAKQEKVAIAFDMEDFADDKSSSSGGKGKDTGERILSSSESLFIPLVEPSEGEEKRLLSLGSFLFKMCCLVVAFLVGGSFLYASKHYSEEHGIMRFMANQDAMKSEVRQYAESRLEWAVGGAVKVSKYFSTTSAKTVPAAPVQLGQYAVLTNDVCSVNTSAPSAEAKKRVPRAVAYRAATKPPVGPKHALPRQQTVWRQTGVHAPLNPAFKIVSLPDPQQEALDAEIQAGVARVNMLAENMRQEMQMRAQIRAPLQCKLLSVSKDDAAEANNDTNIPSCEIVKLLLEPLQSLVDMTKIEIVDNNVEAPTVHVKQWTNGPPLTVRLLDAERMGVFVEVPLGKAAGMMHFDEHGLRATRLEVNAE